MSQLKNQLSAYLKKVRAGESVIIFEGNRPIARLERITAAEYPDDRLARLEREGLLRRGTRPLPLERLRSARARSRRSVLEALLEERRGGR